MTNNLLERAKEIFITYSTSKFQMTRDGLSANYYSYNISPKQEEIWTNELVDWEIKHLDINKHTTLFPLSYIIQTNCLIDTLDKIIDFIQNNIAIAETKDKKMHL